MLNVQVDEVMKNSIKGRNTRLRKKLLDEGAENVVIESIRNVGYQVTRIC